MDVEVITLRIPEGEKFEDLERSVFQFIESERGCRINSQQDEENVTDVYALPEERGTIAYARKKDGCLYQFRQIVEKPKGRAVDRLVECNASVTLVAPSKDSSPNLRDNAHASLRDYTSGTLRVFD